MNQNRKTFKTTTMIDKHSLRIGNKVMARDDNPIITISKLGYKEVEFDDYNLRLDYEEIIGVSLTPELLVDKCGFKKLDPVFKNIQMPYYVHEAVCIFYNEPIGDYSTQNAYLAGFGFTINGEYVAATFKWIYYLHQLQNLFKELTHKELEINNL